MQVQRYSQKAITGIGLGLRNQHIGYILQHKPAVNWFEILSDNYFELTGIPVERICKIRRDYPMVMHGVGLSLGSAGPIDQRYLQQLKNLKDKLCPTWVSEHLSWSNLDNFYSHDLLPLPYNQPSLDNIVNKIDYVQNYLQQSILVENVSTYVTFNESSMPEWEFINQVAQRSGCNVLLDINNIRVNSFNHQFSAQQYLHSIDKRYVKQFHLAGYQDCGSHFIDTHGESVHQEVWDLYRDAIQIFGKVPTLIEWDSNLPDFERLLVEANQANQIFHQLDNQRRAQ